jgi:hypothetical protein
MVIVKSSVQLFELTFISKLLHDLAKEFVEVAKTCTHTTQISSRLCISYDVCTMLSYQLA